MKQILVVTDRHGLALHRDLLLQLQSKLSEEYEVVTVDLESQQLQTYLTHLPVSDFHTLSAKELHHPDIRQKDRWPGQSYKSRSRKYSP